jgi:dienelactone hydrolase
MLARCLPLLADPDRIAALGYGTGGAIALELGRDGVNLRAIGTVNALTTGRPGEAARIRCPVRAGVGSEDPIMPPAQRDAFTAEMQAAGVDWRLVVYGGALHDVIDLLAECLPVTEDLGHAPGKHADPGH